MAHRAHEARDPFIDALRAIALLGVLIVNAVSYPAGPSGSPLGTPMPVDSPAAWAAITLVAWWLQGKAYPLLAFLFGYSLALAMPRTAVAQRPYRRRRMIRMLLLGVLHGTLLYAGDILTLYGLAGLVLLRWPPGPLRRWLVRWQVIAVVALAAFAAGLALTLAPAAFGMEFRSGPVYGEVSGVPGFVALNGRSYWGSLPGAVALFLPEVMLLVVAGHIAGRLRWLTHRRWQPARRAMASRLLPLALLLNLLYAVLMTRAATANSAWQWVLLWTGPPVGWLLSGAIAAGLASWWSTSRPRLLCALAPLGRFSLSAYVGHSLLYALLFSGAGLAWPLGSVGLLVLAAGSWGVCWQISRWADRHGFRGPLEGWMIRA